jgi:phosphate transport system protein
MLEERIISLRREVIEYATHTESMIEQSIQGLLNKDRELLKGIIEHDEPQANEYEILIEEMCIALIARYEPKAKDLRTILMFLKINNDLERAADHAVNISESALFLIGQPPVKPLIDIPKMARESISMIKDSINSFINEDIALAQNVCERDSIVDELGNQTLRELIAFMTINDGAIERSLHLLKIARNLERIADLATNISEDVIFIVEGEIVKHHMSGKDIL